MAKPISYRDAGVNIDEADRAVGAIRKMARATFTKGVLTDIGSFGGCFALPKMKQPVLVSSVDGVGTKLKVAFAAGRHDTVGEDLVNHCVNDIAVLGARPLFFLDYLAVGKLQAGVAAQVVSGIARGCAANGCALIGGETAEMPGMYSDGEYDIAGTIVGIVEKASLLTGAGTQTGDKLLALPSTGLHTNGFSLARKLLLEVAKLNVDSLLTETGTILGDELLKVHRSYLKAISVLLRSSSIRGAAHITGGGITDNLPRALPKGFAASIDTASWNVPPLFELLRRIGSVPVDDWRRTFNLGVGMILVVPENKSVAALRALERAGEGPWIIGEVIPQRRGRGRVEYAEMRLGILISGRGSNFEAIANAVARGKLEAEVAVVISNRASAAGLEIARERGIPLRVLPSAGLNREAWDKLAIEELQTHGVDLVCLAGFMRLLSAGFIRAFPGRILNIHPSLLPAFPGLDAQKQALDYGVKITGCTVHFVDETLDSGPILLQSAVPVFDDDTVDTLSARVLVQEHATYPRAIQLMAEGRVTVDGRSVRVRADQAE